MSRILRDSAVSYRSEFEAIRMLPNDIRLECYDAIYIYRFDGNEPAKLSPTARAIFTLIKPLIDANNKKYINGKKGAEYGIRGGRPPKEEPKRNPKETPKSESNNPRETPNVECIMNNDNVDVDVDENELHSSFCSEILKQTQWKETFMITFKIPNNENYLKAILLNFTKHLILENKSHKNLEDFRQHLNNWCRRLGNELENVYKPKKTVKKQYSDSVPADWLA